MRSIRLLATAATITALSVTGPAFAEEPPNPTPGPSLEDLEDLGRKADELGEQARAAAEEFINLFGPMLSGLSQMIEGLPSYEAPEVLPNGDIIMRRKDPAPPPFRTGTGATET